MVRSVFAAACALCALAGTAAGQIVNGDFETGALTPWVVGFTPNGATTVQTVEMFDIDGPSGPLGDTNAAKFAVGNAATPNQPNQRVEVTQSVALSGGVAYTIKFDYAAIRLSAGNNADGGQFAIIVNGTSLASVATGDTSSSTPHFGTLSATFTPRRGLFHALPLFSCMPEAPSLDRVKSVIRTSLKLPAGTPLADDMPLVGGEYDLDSLDILLIITSIEKEFGIQIPDKKVGRAAFASVRTLTEFVQAQQ